MRRIVLGLVAAGLAVTAGCSSSSPAATLKAVGPGGLGAQIPTVSLDTPLVMPMPDFCTTGAAITITSVSADDAAGGLHVVDWGTRPRTPNDGLGNENGGAVNGLVTQFPGFGHHPVVAKCGQTKTFDEMDISAAMTSPRGTMRGLVITYKSGGSTKTLHTGYELALCTTSTCPEQKHS